MKQKTHPTSKPPKFVFWILTRIVNKDINYSALGDFEEEYNAVVNVKGLAYADFWFLLQVMKSIPSFLVDSIACGSVMLRNYLLIAWRDLKKHKLYSLINIFGLAIGMTGCIIIMLFIQDELSYDRFHKNADRIYRVTRIRPFGEGTQHTTLLAWITGPAIVENFPEVIEAVRVIRDRMYVVGNGDKRFNTNQIYADPNILTSFTFPLIKGNQETALRDPNSVVISEDLVEKIFGNRDPMGKTLTLYGDKKQYDFKITGILKNVPPNSHIKFDFLVPIEHLRIRYALDRKKALLDTCRTYLLLDNYADPKILQEKIQTAANIYFNMTNASQMTYILQPLTAIHLHSNLVSEFEKNSNISHSYYFSIVALVILLIACINFINLATARSSRRSMEVGMRRVIGAGRVQLFRQFLVESFFLTWIALITSVLLAVLLLPYFNSFFGKHLVLAIKGNYMFCLGIIILNIVVGLIAGIYPAIIFSSFHPIEVLKGTVKQGNNLSAILRKGLVIIQFCISLIFIIGTIVIFQQLNYVKKKDLGFDTQNVIQIIIAGNDSLSLRPDMIKNELRKNSNINDLLVAGNTWTGQPFTCIPEGFLESETIELNFSRVGEEYFRFFDIGIVEGRDFSHDITTESKSAVIINESAVKSIGWKYPIGRKIQVKNRRAYSVIGVVKDFHLDSLHEEIKPTVYLFPPRQYTMVFIRINPKDIPNTLAWLEKKWLELAPNDLFNYSFITDNIARQYAEDRQTGAVFTFSTVLAIVLASLGLLGMISFVVQSKKKEISIRKVLGATESNIVALLTWDFSRLILLGSFVAWPIGYIVIRSWLQSFAYRVNIELWIFIAASLIVAFIALITILYHSFKAALSNPVDSLRCE